MGAHYISERGNPLKRFVQSTVTRTTYNQDIKMESSKFSRNMSASRQNVHLLLVACSVFMFLMLSSMLPQTQAVLSGTCGVFDSPAAQEYWARRFGDGQINAARAASMKNLPRLLNHFQDSQNSKKLKQTRFLKLLSLLYYLTLIFQHLLVHTAQDPHFG